MAAYHINGFRQAGAEVIAMADVNQTAADATAAKHGIPQTFGNVAEMFTALPELDGVSVIVPNKFHAPIALQAMQAGKNVFCEKPPAMSAAEMAELKATAESTGQTLMFNFNNRARAESYAMRGYIDDGTISTPARPSGAAAPVFPVSAVGSPTKRSLAAAPSSICCT